MTTLALLAALGVLAQVVETVYLPPMIIPGAKLGLANLITLMLVAFFGWREVLANVVLRVVSVGLLTGTLLSSTFIYSLAGGVTSGAVMLLVYRWFFGRFSFVGVSILGALTHNLAQLLVSFVILAHVGMILFLPWLIFMAITAGLANGILANLVVARVGLAKLVISW